MPEEPSVLFTHMGEESRRTGGGADALMDRTLGKCGLLVKAMYPFNGFVTTDALFGLSHVQRIQARLMTLGMHRSNSP